MPFLASSWQTWSANLRRIVLNQRGAAVLIHLRQVSAVAETCPSSVFFQNVNAIYTPENVALIWSCTNYRAVPVAACALTVSIIQMAATASTVRRALIET